MKGRVEDVRKQGDKLFADKRPLDNLWQQTAENFYPERATFTSSRYLGEDLAAHLMTGYPALVRRDLANSLSAMLRPRGQSWFYARTLDENINKDANARKWLDWASDVMRRIIYDKKAQFVRATKEGDNDFATFGQCVISIDMRMNLDGLLFRCWHLKNCAWKENAELEVDTFHRRWKPTARELVRMFPKTVSSNVRTAMEKEPFKEINCRHVVMPADEYDLAEGKNRRRLPFVSLYVDCENEVVLEEVAMPRLGYVIPRWQTVSGSQYAHSPASVIALPDARLLQDITRTLLEAGQKAVDPPMAAVGEAISGPVNLYAGGVTWLDAEYDERLGGALRQAQDIAPNLGWGVDREQRIQQMIEKAFFIDQLGLPPIDAEKMTAYEVRLRQEEYMRRALPLFEPMESEYNGAICDQVFDIAIQNGAFGPPETIPDMLRGQDIRFQFESPIQQSATRANAAAFQQSAQLLAIAVQMDPGAAHIINVDQATRDALDGAGAPATWINSEEDVAKAKQAAAEAQAPTDLAGAVATGADVAMKVGDAGQSLMAAGMA